MTVALFVRIETREGHRDDFVRRVTEHRQNVLANEPWCQRFDVLVPEDDDNLVCLYEVYDDRDAVQKHGETRHMQEYRADTEPWLLSRDRLLSTIVE